MTIKTCSALINVTSYPLVVIVYFGLVTMFVAVNATETVIVPAYMAICA